ncbi:MAG TPA: hypothetical protein VM681_08075 [Candidatus Thermoplasmatota archaeon]|nr:hypothetical protein [Candidatus Thermoplasmatota archaeon]
MRVARVTACGLAFLALAGIPLLPGAQSQSGLTADLLSFASSYGVERWKDEPARDAASLGPPALGGLGVYENPYFVPGRVHDGPDGVFLGLNLTARIVVRGPDGQPPAPTQNLVVRASIPVAGGEIPAKMARLAAFEFQAEFDLDGENGRDFPALFAGPHAIEAEILEIPADPLGLPQRVGRSTLSFSFLPGSLGVLAHALPESILPGLADVGPGNRTAVASATVSPREPLPVAVSFPGAAGAQVEIAAFEGPRRTLVHRGALDASGATTVSFAPATALGQNASGLLVLEAHLVGEGRAAGGVTVAVPASDHPVRVAAIQFVPRGVAGQPVSQVDTVQFTVRDPNPSPLSASKRGTLYVLDRTGEVAANAEFSPTGFLPGSAGRTASVPAPSIRAMGGTSYRVAALLFDAQDRFYGLATAVRGFSVLVQPPEARADEPSELRVTVRNHNNNLDLERDDGLALSAVVLVSGLAGAAHREDVALDEGQERIVTIPFQAAAGYYAVQVNVTAGELAHGEEAAFRVAARGGPFEGLPAPGGALAAAALAAGVLLRTRRERL